MNPGVVSSEEFELKNVAESTGSNILFRNEYHTLILVQKISQNMHFEVRRNIGNPCPTPPSLRTIVNFKIVVFVINFQLWLSRQDVITTYSVLNIGDIMPTGHHR